jgi:DHA1 family tetracycline resistance protein-like MFS transporter
VAAARYNAGPMSEPVALPSADVPPPRGALGVVLMIVFIDLMGFGIILPQLPFYAIHFHASAFAVAMLFSIYSACQFVAAPVLGMISDRVGRKPVLAVSQLGSALGYGLLGITTQLHFDNAAVALGLVYLARVIDGSTGGNISTAQAYISDVTTPATRARGMGLFGAMFGVGFAVGPVLGGIVGNDSDRAAWPAYLAALLSLTAAILSVWRLPESRSDRPANDEVWLHPSRFAPLFRRQPLGSLLLSTFATMTAFTMLEGTIGLYLHDHFRKAGGVPYGERELAWYFAYIGVIITVVQGGVVARAVKRFGEWAVGIAGCLFVAGGMSLYVVTGHHPLLSILLTAGAVNAVGRSLQGPPISSLISKVSGRDEQGTVFGVYHGLGSLARALGPAIAGLAYARVAAIAPFAIAGTMMVVIAAWLAGLRRAHPIAVPPPTPRGFEPIVGVADPSAEADVEVAQVPS